MVPRRIILGAWSLDVRADAERGAEAEQDGRRKEDGYLGAEAAGAEFLDASSARDEETAEDERDG